MARSLRHSTASLVAKGFGSSRISPRHSSGVDYHMSMVVSRFLRCRRYQVRLIWLASQPPGHLCTAMPLANFFMSDIRRCLEGVVTKVPEVSVLDDTEYPRAVALAHHNARLGHMKHIFGPALPADVADQFQFVSSQTADAWNAFVQRAKTKRDFQKRMCDVVSSHAYDSILKEIYPAGAPLGTRRSRRVAKFLSSTCREAVEFSRAVPTLPSLSLSAPQYLMAMAYHLHLPVPGRPLLPDTCLTAITP